MIITNKPYGSIVNGRIPLERRLAAALMARAEDVRGG